MKKAKLIFGGTDGRKISRHLLHSKRQVDAVTQERLIKQELDGFKAAMVAVETSTLPREVRKILQLIHQELFEPSLKVFELRRKCGIRNNNISTEFRRVVGMGIREYIEDLRIQAAKRLLSHRQLEIFRIGFTTGYAHEESFTRAFHRRMGYTPSQYRRENVKKECQTK